MEITSKQNSYIKEYRKLVSRENTADSRVFSLVKEQNWLLKQLKAVVL